MASADAAEEIVYKKVGEYLVDTDIDRELGSTTMSHVFAGKHATSGEKVAAKLINWGKEGSHDMIEDEVKIMRTLPPHENTVKFYDYIKKDMGHQWQLWIILEKCDLGDLEKFSTARQLNVKQTLDLFLQAAKGLQHIHDNKLVHRDIKLQNLLVHGTKDNPVVKIADYGISRIIQGKSTAMTPIGTPSTIAPELLNKGKPRAGQEVDTFSLAVSFLPLLDPQDASTEYKVDDVPLGEYLHRHPNTNVSALINKARDTEDVRRIKQVLAAMLAPAAADRPTMEQVVVQLSHIHNLLNDKDNLHDVSTAIRAQKASPGSDGAAATSSHDSAAGTQGVDKVRTGKVLDLLHGSDDGKKEQVLDPPRVSADGKTGEEVVLAVSTFGSNNGVWVLDDKGGWVKQSDVPEECRVKGACVCGIPGGFVLFGGWDCNDKATSKCWIFSLHGKQWEKIQDMLTARYCVTAVLVGHSIFAFGGRDNPNHNLDVAERFDLVTKKWFSAAPMPQAIVAPLVAAMAGQIYIKGRASRHFFSFQPDQNSYTAIPVPDFVPERFYAACMISHSNKLYLLSGMEERVAVQYDLLTKSWRKLTPPRSTYRRGYCPITRDNAILLCGGSTEGDSGCNIVEKYDVATDAWEQSDLLPFAYNGSWCRVLNSYTPSSSDRDSLPSVIRL